MRLAWLFLISLFLVSAAQAEGIRCYGTLSPQEKLICESGELLETDFKLSQLYSLAYALADAKGAIKKTQLRWLKDVRSQCKDRSCLSKTYEKRIDELLGFIQDNSEALPPNLSGTDEHTGKGQSHYCKLNDIPHYMDDFSIEADFSDLLFNGHIAGIYDCGRKIWESDVKGTVKGKVAFVEFDAGFNEPQPVQAIICFARQTIYWRAIGQSKVESYIPTSRNIRVAP